MEAVKTFILRVNGDSYYLARMYPDKDSLFAKTISAKYSYIRNLEGKEGEYRVNLNTDVSILRGVINEFGQEILPPIYHTIQPAGNDYIVQTKETNSTGVVNANNDVVIPLENETIFYDAEAKGFYVTNTKGSYGFFDENGKQTIPFKYSSIKNIKGTRLFLVSKGFENGIVTANGRIRVAFRDALIVILNNKVFSIQDDSGAWLENFKGERVSDKFVSIKNYDKETNTVTVKNTAGFVALMDLKGKIITSVFKRISEARNGYRFISGNDGHAYYMDSDFVIKKWNNKELASALCHSEDLNYWYFPKVFKSDLRSSERKFQYEKGKEYNFPVEENIYCECGSGLNLATKNWLSKRLRKDEIVHFIAVPKTANIIVPVDLQKVRCDKGTILDFEFSRKDIEEWLKRKE